MNTNAPLLKSLAVRVALLSDSHVLTLISQADALHKAALWDALVAKVVPREEKPETALDAGAFAALVDELRCKEPAAAQVAP